MRQKINVFLSIHPVDIPLYREVAKAKVLHTYNHMHFLISLPLGLLGKREQYLLYYTAWGTISQYNQWFLQQGPTVELVYPYHITIDPTPSPHKTQSTGETRCSRTFSQGCQGFISIHIFTNAFRSSLSCINILSCYTDIPIASNALFTLSIHLILRGAQGWQRPPPDFKLAYGLAPPLSWSLMKETKYTKNTQRKRKRGGAKGGRGGKGV